MSVLVLRDSDFDSLAEAALWFGIAANRRAGQRLGRVLRRRNLEAYAERYSSAVSSDPTRQAGLYRPQPSGRPTDVEISSLIRQYEYNNIASVGWAGSEAEQIVLRFRRELSISPALRERLAKHRT